MEQTALDWFESKYKDMCNMQGSVSPNYTLFLIEQARFIQKENIQDVFKDGYEYGWSEAMNMCDGVEYKGKTPSEYYNEKYKK